MSFVNGVMQALGFRAGMALSQETEMRPVLRKRRFATYAYLASLLIIGCIALSWQPQAMSSHLTAVLARAVGWSPLYWFTVPWRMTWLAFMMAGLLTIFVVLLPQRPVLGDLNQVESMIIRTSYAFLSYAWTYDFVYYTVGNRCVSWVNVLCFNGANTAGMFAASSMGVYLIRTLFVLRPEEKGTALFNNNRLKDMVGPKNYWPPELPMPHIIWVAINYAFDYIPVGWTTYVHPDGREQAQQRHIRR